MKIVVDAFGGDNAPQAIVDGAVAAVAAREGLEVVLTGDSEKLNALLEGRSRNITVLHAPDVITNDDAPTSAVKKKTRSSMVVGLDTLASDDSVSAMVSAGSTGALLTGGFMKLGRIKGISRPAMAPMLPSLSSQGVVLCDCGANADCKPVNLLHFAIMGTTFYTAMTGKENPAVALLNNGTEEHKGNELTKQAYELLKQSGLNFIGNVEARNLITGAADVIVADGFSGNVALKSCEGTALSMFSLIKKGINEGGLKAKIGALLLKPVFRKIKKVMDYGENGGACFLGINKVLIKAHGSASAKSVCAAVLQAAQLAEAGITDKIREGVAGFVSETAE